MFKANRLRCKSFFARFTCKQHHYNWREKLFQKAATDNQQGSIHCCTKATNYSNEPFCIHRAASEMNTCEQYLLVSSTIHRLCSKMILWAEVGSIQSCVFFSSACFCMDGMFWQIHFHAPVTMGIISEARVIMVENIVLEENFTVAHINLTMWVLQRHLCSKSVNCRLHSKQMGEDMHVRCRSSFTLLLMGTS